MSRWTPEFIEYSNFVDRNKQRLVPLESLASIDILRKAVGLDIEKDGDCLFASLSGQDVGSVSTFAGVLQRQVPEKLVRLSFVKIADKELFLCYSLTNAYKNGLLSILQGHGGRNTLSQGEFGRVLVPCMDKSIISRVAILYEAISSVQSTSVPTSEGVADEIMQKELHLDRSKSPEVIGTKWAFERHAHHVTGLSWDHARDLEPLTLLTESWLLTSNYPCKRMEEVVCVESRGGCESILLPYDFTKLNRVSVASEKEVSKSRYMRRCWLMPGVDAEYVCSFLKTEFVYRYLNATRYYGHTLVQEILSTPIILPDKSIQRNIVSQINSAYSEIDKAAATRKMNMEALALEAENMFNNGRKE